MSFTGEDGMKAMIALCLAVLAIGGGCATEAERIVKADLEANRRFEFYEQCNKANKALNKNFPDLKWGEIKPGMHECVIVYHAEGKGQLRSTYESKYGKTEIWEYGTCQFPYEGKHGSDCHVRSTVYIRNHIIQDISHYER